MCALPSPGPPTPSSPPRDGSWICNLGDGAWLQDSMLSCPINKAPGSCIPTALHPTLQLPGALKAGQVGLDSAETCGQTTSPMGRGWASHAWVPVATEQKQPCSPACLALRNCQSQSCQGLNALAWGLLRSAGWAGLFLLSSSCLCWWTAQVAALTGLCWCCAMLGGRSGLLPSVPCGAWEVDSSPADPEQAGRLLPGYHVVPLLPSVSHGSSRGGSWCNYPHCPPAEAGVRV